MEGFRMYYNIERQNSKGDFDIIMGHIRPENLFAHLAKQAFNVDEEYCVFEIDEDHMPRLKMVIKGIGGNVGILA